VQRTVDDYTRYMVRARIKCKMDEKISYTIPECGGLQGMGRAITTCRLALNREAPSYPKVSMHLSTTLMYKETTDIPLGL
jgi:hypothetical protein